MKLSISAILMFALLFAPPCLAATTHNVITDNYGERGILIYVPSHLPEPGKRALVIVMHGGMGNAERIASGQSENGLNMNAMAEKKGFIVAYLNGTPVARFLGADKLGWNAGGGCCGQPARNNVDDVSYIKNAANYLVRKYAIDQSRIYAMGHSNGAIMAQRLICETTLLTAIVAISGPLNIETQSCPDARGKHILAIHGAQDENVPVIGGQGSKGLSHVAFNSEEYSQQVFTNSGATYTLDVVQGADHMLDHINAALWQNEHVTIAEKSAQFFGL